MQSIRKLTGDLTIVSKTYCDIYMLIFYGPCFIVKGNSNKFWLHVDFKTKSVKIS